jgi:Ca2+-binding RTX toxin-like protein
MEFKDALLNLGGAPVLLGGNGTITSVEIFELVDGLPNSIELAESLISSSSTSSITVDGGSGVDFVDGDLSTATSLSFLDTSLLLSGNGGNDILYGGSGNDTLDGGSGNDSLAGGGTDDVLFGGAGTDILDGGVSGDLMEGGLGGDTYFVDASDDVIVEEREIHLDGGFDQVLATVTYELAANVERLALLGAFSIDGTGNSANNVLSGNPGHNDLYGLGGADVISGGNFDDYLDGGTGADLMDGGEGNDTYVIDNAGDIVVETDNSGYDEVLATLAIAALLDNFEQLIGQSDAGQSLSGNSLDNIINGADGADVLSGADGADTIIGNDGADHLYGDEGDDVLAGNDGDDQHWGHDGDDTFKGGLGADIIDGGDGNDTVNYDGSINGVSVDLNTGLGSVGNYALGDTLTGIENLIGTEFEDTLTGDASINVLDGGAGADTMDGGQGSDTYIVDNTRDEAIETTAGAAGGLNDQVFSSVNHTLSANVENLTITAVAGQVNGTGNTLANTIAGNIANSYIDGKEGNDVLTGNGGSDQFLFTTALSAAANLDQITDSDVADDYLRIDNAVFAALPVGYLSVAALHIGASAADSLDRIIYDDATGNIYYDPDGLGGVAQTQFATLTAGLTLGNGDIYVF